MPRSSLKSGDRGNTSFPDARGYPTRCTEIPHRDMHAMHLQEGAFVRG